ncbi:MAG: hypothetical protein AAF645_07320 [Myxococcota bacterium]
MRTARAWAHLTICAENSAAAYGSPKFKSERDSAVRIVRAVREDMSRCCTVHIGAPTRMAGATEAEEKADERWLAHKLLNA